MKPNQPFFLSPKEETRFWSHVEVKRLDECWEWMAYRDKEGYGRANFGFQGLHRTHRMAWTICFGLIPDAIRVLHKCDNPPCCNPCHLFTGTQAENIEDMRKKRRTTFGERSWSAKLTESQVLEIRSLYKRYDPRFNGYALCKRYGISYSTIYAIIHRTKWKHI